MQTEKAKSPLLTEREEKKKQIFPTKANAVSEQGS